MIKLTALLFLFLVFSPAFGQKRNKKSKEDTFMEQGKEDVFAITSSSQFDYLDKFHLAVREKLSGNLSEAKRLFLECMEEHPNNDAVYFALAEIAKKQKLKSEALRFFLEAQRLDPKNLYYVHEIAFLQLDKAQFEAAAANLKILTDKEPRHAEWQYAYAQSLIYSGKYKEAIVALDKVEDLMGPIPDITMIKIELYQETKQEEKIEPALLKLKKAFPQDLDVLKTVIGYYEENKQQQKAIALIEELVAVEPDNSIAHFILSKYHGEQQNDEKYQRHLVLVMQSSDVPLEEKLGLMQMAFENPALSTTTFDAYFEAMTQMYENDVRLHAFYGDYLVRNARINEALAQYRKALATAPSEFGVWSTVLAFQSAYKFYRPLYEDAQKALELFPSVPFVYYSAAEGALQSGDADEALQLLEMGKSYLLDDKMYQSRFFMRYGEVYFTKKDSKKGTEYMEKALKLQPNAEPILVSYAFHLSQFGKDHKSAEKLLLPLLKNKEVGSRVYYTLAVIYLNQEAYLKGIRLVETALEESAYKAELTDILGDLYFHNKEQAKAIQLWEKALILESSNKNLTKKIAEQTYYAPSYY